MRRYSYNWVGLLLGVLLISACGGYTSARKRGLQSALPQALVGGQLQCDSSGNSRVGSFDVVIRPAKGQEELSVYELYIVPIRVDLDKTARVSINIVEQSSLAFREMVAEVSPFRSGFFAGYVTLDELNQYRILSIAKVIPGKTFLEVPERDAVLCEMPLPGDGVATDANGNPVESTTN